MSDQVSPEAEKMDISDSSSTPEDAMQTSSTAITSLFPDIGNREGASAATAINLAENRGCVDNQLEHDRQLLLDNNERCNKNTTPTTSTTRRERTAGQHPNRNLSLSSQNATDSHPLMYYSPATSPDFPDLIPEQSRKLAQAFTPIANSTGHGSEYHLHTTVDKFTLDLSHVDESLDDVVETPVAVKCKLYHGDGGSDSATANDLSDNENDQSAYEARLSSNLQNVSMKLTEKEGNLNFLAHNKQSNKLRKIKILPISAEDDDDSELSSAESNSDSLKSEDVFQGYDNDGDDEDDDQPRSNTPEPIEPLSAEEERRHARHWQRMILPGGNGEQRTIDMRVIEPYKRVLSHGGYLQAAGQTAIVLFSACFLPDKSRIDYEYVMDNLFLYVLWTLERLITEDYVLVYLNGGATRLPSFRWLKRCYQMVGRKLRKNLSHLYIVHPTLWIKTMLFMAKPFISSKFYRKISYVVSLRELKVRVPIEVASIPDKVKAYDQLHCTSS